MFYQKISATPSKNGKKFTEEKNMFVQKLPNYLKRMTNFGAFFTNDLKARKLVWKLKKVRFGFVQISDSFGRN